MCTMNPNTPHNVWMPNTNFGYYYSFLPTQQSQNQAGHFFRPIVLNPQFCNNMLLPNIAPNHPVGYSESNVEEIVPDFRCDLCSTRIPTYTEFKEHFAVHRDINQISSIQARLLEAFGRNAWKKPIGRSSGDGKKFFCQCGQVFKYRGSLADHSIKHRKGLVCTFCNIKFSASSSLHKHYSMQHTMGKNRRHCPHCNYRCYQFSDLEKHVARRHTRDFKYKCFFCIKGFVTPKELSNHLRRKHSNFIANAI